ncbi:hypothetical protein [Nocardia macrotermitis]|uniref:Uncharacterized protein n=1 Tax=Nocardia macrotermitis TaxID=2585198 RepID=A0A7K0CWH1_9NOCA|nr:hypothetical protein [Nocardia macrotermitis]MQY17004.1 hypothetical protein [Nocardia macrotermitis]
MCYQSSGSPAVSRATTATIDHADVATTPVSAGAQDGADGGPFDSLPGPDIACSIRRDDLSVIEAHRIMQRHRACAGTECAARAAALEVLVDSGRYVLSTSRRHVHIEFGSVGIGLDYQCPHAVAEEFAERMRTHPDASVTIDHDLHPDLPPLPCAGLWPGTGVDMDQTRSDLPAAAVDFG